MTCEYCVVGMTRMLFNNRDRLSYKKDAYPGIEAEIDAINSTIWIGACADTYEPAWVEAEIPINFCPICGEQLREKLIGEE